MALGSLKDHLGNARVTFRDMDNNGSISANEVTQEAHYYPFGMRFAATEGGIFSFKTDKGICKFVFLIGTAQTATTNTNTIRLNKRK